MASTAYKLPKGPYKKLENNHFLVITIPDDRDHLLCVCSTIIFAIIGDYDNSNRDDQDVAKQAEIN